MCKWCCASSRLWKDYKNHNHVACLKEECNSLSPTKRPGCAVSTTVPIIWDWLLRMERVQTSRGNSSDTQGPLCYRENTRISWEGCENKMGPWTRMQTQLPCLFHMLVRWFVTTQQTCQSGGTREQVDRPNGERRRKVQPRAWVSQTRGWGSETRRRMRCITSEQARQRALTHPWEPNWNQTQWHFAGDEFKIESNDRGQRCLAHKNNHQRDKLYGGNEQNVSPSYPWEMYFPPFSGGQTYPG